MEQVRNLAAIIAKALLIMQLHRLDRFIWHRVYQRFALVRTARVQNPHHSDPMEPNFWMFAVGQLGPVLRRYSPTVELIQMVFNLIENLVLIVKEKVRIGNGEA